MTTTEQLIIETLQRGKRLPAIISILSDELEKYREALEQCRKIALEGYWTASRFAEEDRFEAIDRVAKAILEPDATATEAEPCSLPHQGEAGTT